MPNYQEQNAKADQIGAGIALGCIGIPVILFVVLLVIVALVG